MGSVRLGLVTVCHSLSEFFCFVTIVNMVVVKVQGGKKVTGPVASSLPVTVRDTARDRQREVVAARLVQTHSMVAATVMLLVMSLTLLSLANFRDVGVHGEEVHAQGAVGKGCLLQGNPVERFHPWPCCARGHRLVQGSDGPVFRLSARVYQGGEQGGTCGQAGERSL